MNKRTQIALYTVIGICLFYFLIRAIVPGILDRRYNTVQSEAPYDVSSRAMSLYKSLDFVADLHCDVLLWDRNILDRHNHGHVDVPRLIEANVALQAFTIVSKTPRNLNYQRNDDDSDDVTLLNIVQGRPYSTIFSLKKRALDQSARLYTFAQNSGKKLRFIKSAAELDQYLKDRSENRSITAGFLGAEGAHIFEGDLQAIDDLYAEGLRMVGPVHFFDNELGGSAHGINKGGLTKFGREAIRHMQQLGIIIDLSHASTAMINEILAISTKPLIVSHTGVKGTCDNNRNLSDAHLRGIAAGGGLIGIAVFEQAVCGLDAMATARAIKHTVDLVGIDYVGLGSDFDGAVRAHFDVTGLPLIVDALLQLQFSEEDIKKIMGDNVKAFLLRNLPSQ